MKKKVLKKPNPLIYFPLLTLMRIWYFFNFKVTIKNTVKDDIKGPCFILCTHPSFFDFAHVLNALPSKRISFVANRFYFNLRPFSKIPQCIGMIPKRLFTSDTDTIRKIMKAIKSNHIVVMMPEGRLSADGTNFQLASGTEKLIKLLKVDVYKIHTEGAYFAKPRWAKEQRHAKLTVNIEKILDKNMVKDLSKEEINDILCDKMQYEDALHEKLISCKDRTLGLDDIINYCPSCNSFLSMVAQNHTMHCSTCGYEAFMDEYCTFTTGKFKTIHEWYSHQGEIIVQKLHEKDFSMDVTTTMLSTVQKKFVDVGTGKLTLSSKGLLYEGDIVKDNNLVVKDIFEKDMQDLEAFVFSIKRGLQMYIGEDLYFFMPKENPKQMVFWSQAFDKMQEKSSCLPTYHKDN